MPFAPARPWQSCGQGDFAILAAGIFLPMGPLAGYLRLVPVPPAWFGWLTAILLAYAVLTTLMKRACIRRFGWQSTEAVLMLA